MAILIHNCDTTINFAPDNGTISVDTVDKAPITPNIGCILWQIDATPYATWLRLNQPMNLAGANVIHFPYKTSDATKPHSLIVRTDYQNFNSYEFTSQLITGEWVIVTIDLTKPTSTTGTLNLASINNFMWEVDSYHTAAEERLDEIEADVATGTTYTLTIQAGAGGTTNPAPATYGPYTPGSVQSVIAIPNSGQAFNGWTLDGANAGTVNPYIMTMNTNHTLLASFVPISTGETMLYQSNFAGGTIAPFLNLMDAGGQINFLTAAQDPLGANKPCVQLINNSAGGHGSIGLQNFGGSKSVGYVVYGSLRVITVQARPDVQKWTGVAMIRHPDMYTTGIYYAIVDIFGGKLRLQYLDGGSMKALSWTSGVGQPQPNVAETYELYVKTGQGNGIVTLKKTTAGVTTTLFTSSTVNNAIASVNPPGSIGSVEAGTTYGDANSIVYIYDSLIVYETPFVPFPTVNIIGTVLDVNGAPIENVGVRYGSEIDQNVPWIVITFKDGGYTDSNGKFSFTCNPGQSIPEIRFIRVGYGDPSIPVGSVTEILNVTAPTNGTLDLGNIVPQAKTPIAPAVLPSGPLWAIRAITIFPFDGYTGTFANHIQQLVQKGFKFNVIQLRTQVVGQSASSLSVDDGQGGYPISGALAGADIAHQNGFQVMLSINGYNGDAGNHQGITTPDPTWMTSYKQCCLQVAQGCISHNIEYLLIEFENYTFAGQETAAWIDIINSIRALPGWKGKVGVTMNLMGATSYADFQSKALLDRALWSIVDFIQYENWTRTSNIADPTEALIQQMWSANLSWDDYHPNWAAAFPWIKQQFPNALFFMNCGCSNSDECAIYPWGHGLSNIVNQEAQALWYKSTFDFFQNVALDGWNMEHYTFDPMPATDGSANNCFNGGLCEGFIAQGLLAHATGEPAPPPTPTFPSAAKVGGLILLGLSTAYAISKA